MSEKRPSTCERRLRLDSVCVCVCVCACVSRTSPLSNRDGRHQDTCPASDQETPAICLCLCCRLLDHILLHGALFRSIDLAISGCRPARRPSPQPQRPTPSHPPSTTQPEELRLSPAKPLRPDLPAISNPSCPRPRAHRQRQSHLLQFLARP